MPNALHFTTLRIERRTYGENKGQLIATLTADYGTTTKLEVSIPEHVTNDIMKMIAPAIASEVAATLFDVQRDHEAWMLTHDQETVEGSDLTTGT